MLLHEKDMISLTEYANGMYVSQICLQMDPLNNESPLYICLQNGYPYRDDNRMDPSLTNLLYIMSYNFYLTHHTQDD